jgi:hypothetical protein
MHWQWFDRWAIREGAWKLVRDPRDGKRLRLYNLEDAQPEREDHAADRPELVRRLERLHDAWAQSVRPKPR